MKLRLKGRKGFFAWVSVSLYTLIGGQLLALLVRCVILQQVLEDADFVPRDWRIPFALGAVLAVVWRYGYVASWMKATSKHETRALKRSRFVEGLYLTCAAIFDGAWFHRGRLAVLLYFHHHLYAEISDQIQQVCMPMSPAAL